MFMVPFDDDHRPLVESLLTKLPDMWAKNGTVSTATGAAVQSAILALRPTGGRIVLVQVRSTSSVVIDGLLFLPLLLVSVSGNLSFCSS